MPPPESGFEGDSTQINAMKVDSMHMEYEVCMGLAHRPRRESEFKITLLIRLILRKVSSVLAESER